MIKRFRIDRNDGRIYAMGATAVSGGVHFSFASKGEACAVVFYRKGAGSPKGRIRFPANARTGDVWSMTVLGDFSGLEYVYEVDGQQVPDPYGRRFTGMERWGSPVRLDKPVRTPVDTEGSAPMTRSLLCVIRLPFLYLFLFSVLFCFPEKNGGEHFIPRRSFWIALTILYFFHPVKSKFNFYIIFYNFSLLS